MRLANRSLASGPEHRDLAAGLQQHACGPAGRTGPARRGGIKVEGNTDERGVEYNLSLGQGRAEAVRHALRICGVADLRYPSR